MLMQTVSISTSDHACLSPDPGAAPDLGSGTLAYEECCFGTLSSALLARHRIPLALNDKLVHQTRVENLPAKALLLQQL